MYNINVTTKKFLADTSTPVSIYLRLRDMYSQCFLLESVDYRPDEQCFSYICCDPIAEFRVERESIVECFPDGKNNVHKITDRADVSTSLQSFLNKFKVNMPSEYNFLSNGLFGYTAYDAIRYFDSIEIDTKQQQQPQIPDILYYAFRYVIAINHFRNEMFIMNNRLQGQESKIDLDNLAYIATHKDFPNFSFERYGEETSNVSDEEFLETISKCKEHIHRGDVFQIVPSRRFQQSFIGDEFNVYRALRSINPSPYLFYFDYGGFKIFGSSPEPQLTVSNNSAQLYPIAGTYKRTGNDAVDNAAIEKLSLDPKENAEHVMLVDLARNDLSKHCHSVEVKSYKQVKMYSHVIHLTSQVCGQMEENTSALNVLHDTFPMGTLSGAPKYKAMQLLNKYEKTPRRAYGGSIGCLDFSGNINHAIIIRSFISEGSTLYFQAGAGIVSESVPENELNEVHNKLQALKVALTMAEEMA